MNKKEQRLKETDERLLNFIGLEYPYNRPKSDWAKVKDPSKKLIYPDPHSPYTNKFVKSRMIQKEKDASTLICTGDIGDYYSKSRFPKQRLQLFNHEVRALFNEVEWLSTNWEEVFIEPGNHDDRSEKLINNLLHGNTDLLLMVEPNLLRWIASFFDNVEIVGTQVDLLGMDTSGLQIMNKKMISHIYQYGDIVFTHAERSNANKLTLMKNISDWLREWSQLIGLKPYTFIVQSHNHSDMKLSNGTEKWFLIPTAATPLSVGFEYILAPKMYGKPPSVGYAVFYQMNGVTDYNRSTSILI